MNVWAFDLGTHYGWAVYRDGKIHSGHEQLKHGKDPHAGQRYILMTDSLNRLGERFGRPEIVWYERVIGFDKTAQQSYVYGGFWAMLQSWMYLGCPEVELRHVAVSTLKKWAVGHGRGKKKEMIRRLQAQGFEVTDDNEADAIWCLRYGLWRMNQGEMDE